MTRSQDTQPTLRHARKPEPLQHRNKPTQNSELIVRQAPRDRACNTERLTHSGAPTTQIDAPLQRHPQTPCLDHRYNFCEHLNISFCQRATPEERSDCTLWTMGRDRGTLQATSTVPPKLRHADDAPIPATAGVNSGQPELTARDAVSQTDPARCLIHLHERGTTVLL